jgi:hypothetical protein
LIVRLLYVLSFDSIIVLLEKLPTRLKKEVTLI